MPAGAGSNSITDSLWPISWHIDGGVQLGRAAGGSWLQADRFPAYEVLQYPRYSVNAFARVNVLGQRGQVQITNLLDGPLQQPVTALANP